MSQSNNNYINKSNLQGSANLGNAKNVKEMNKSKPKYSNNKNNKA